MGNSKMRDFQKRIDLGKQSSMLVWFPKLEKLPIPQIKTRIINIDSRVFYKWIVGEGAIPEKYWTEMLKEIEALGGCPIFMRSDQSSMKHSWKKTCYLADHTKLQDQVRNLIEDHEMQNMAGELSYDAIVFRDFLDLETGFKGFHGDFPVNKEVRSFINDGKLTSIHNYWFEDAIEKGSRNLPDNWKEKLKDLNTITKKDLDEIKQQLNEVGKVFPDGYWSVDFAKTKDGIWYLIDMAKGEVSYHPENIIEGKQRKDLQLE